MMISEPDLGMCELFEVDRTTLTERGWSAHHFNESHRILQLEVRQLLACDLGVVTNRLLAQRCEAEFESDDSLTYVPASKSQRRAAATMAWLFTAEPVESARGQ